MNLGLIRSNEILAKNGFLYTTARDLGDHKIQRDGCCMILVHCCTRISVGQTGQCGDPLYAAVFSLSSCHGHIWPNLVNFFLQKAHATYIDDAGKDKTI